MLSLFVDCNLKETENELSRSYDDIPTYVAPGAAVRSDPPPAAASADTVEVNPIPQVEVDIAAQIEPEVEPELEPVVAREVDAGVEAEPDAGVEIPVVSEPFDPAPRDWVYQPPRRFPRPGWLVAATAVAASLAGAVIFLNLPARVPRNRVSLPTPARSPAPVVAAQKAPEPAAPMPSAEPHTPSAEAHAPGVEPHTPGAAPAVTAAATAACRVKVVSEPSGADVLLAGRSLGHTPTSPLEVPCGASLTVRRPRYQMVATLVPTEPSEQVREIAAHLERPTAMLEVTSAPSGANVVMHGRTVGQTPALLSVFEYDSFQFEIQAKGFAPLKKQIYLRTTSASFHADLVPAAASDAEPTP
jgi:hypothetical protein